MTTNDGNVLDVLIVGAGPTGLTAALLLARAGLACELVEKRPGPQRAPAAHVVNARTFEIWRQAGLDMDGMLALAKDPRDAGEVHWVTKLGGEILGSLPFERQGDDVLALTPTPLRNLSQHRLERFLHDDVARVAGIAARFECRWESSVQDDAGVTSTLRDPATGKERRVRSRYLIAADGAGSPVRKSLGIECIGPARLQAFVMIHFAANLRSLVGERPGVLFWTSDPECTGIFVAHDIDREWVFMHAWDPDREHIDAYDAARCEAIVRRAMATCGAPQEPAMQIRTIAPWVMTSQTAERYRDRRIFLAGDAAHRFPPTGGLGLNTGVQDAHNLAWKIVAVERGWADARLLDTYEAERRPIACYNAEQSLVNAMRLMEIPQAMGTADEPAAARRNFDAMLADAGRRRSVAEAIEHQAEHFDMLGLQLGYAYVSDAVVSDATEPGRPANPVRQFSPSSRPGARLPHGWVVRDGRRVSTLDLIAGDGMTVFVRTPNPLESIETPVPLHVVQWDADVVDAGNWWGGVAGLDDDGVLLVRPDQHVAARLRTGAGDAAVEAALAVLFSPAPSPHAAAARASA